MNKFWNPILWLAAAGVVTVTASAQSDESVIVHMPDGQLRSHLVEVYINRTITREMQPCLGLLTADMPANPPATIDSCRARDDSWEPVESSVGIQWNHPTKDRTVAKTGTIRCDLGGSRAAHLPYGDKPGGFLGAQAA